jgi:hypothetical protein
MSPLLKKVSRLKAIDQKASYQIAKEISIINLNIMWYPDSLLETAARVDSLVEHICRTFPNNSTATAVCFDLTEIAQDIRAYVELNPA